MKIFARYSLFVLTLALASLTALAQQPSMAQMAKMEAIVGKKGILNINSTLKAGAVTLKSGTYQVQHVMEGEHHVIVLREVPAGQGFRGGNTTPGKEVARLRCKYEPSDQKWRNTMIMVRKNDQGEKEIVEIRVAGEKFIHRL